MTLDIVTLKTTENHMHAVVVGGQVVGRVYHVDGKIINKILYERGEWMAQGWVGIQSVDPDPDGNVTLQLLVPRGAKFELDFAGI